MNVSADYILTPEEESKMLIFWNATPDSPPSLDKLTQHVSGDDTLDGRSNYAKAIKRCLAKHGLNAKTKTKYIPVMSESDLTDAHKEFIRKNVNTMTSLEMANELFGDGRKLEGNSAEARLVKNFVVTLDTRTRVVEDNLPTEDYKPPKTLEQALARVNKYVDYVSDFKKLNAGNRRCLLSLIGYLHTHRFARQINSYDDEADRQSLEDAFIRCTYDKHDLMQEEVDEYISYATEVVMGFSIQRRSESLQRQLDAITSADAENARISMSLVEAIGKAQGEYNQCSARQQKLLSSLKQKRSDRLAKSISDNASILNLVELWRNYETRQDMLKMADKEDQEITDEIDRLKNIDDIRARIMGLTEDEARGLS